MAASEEQDPGGSHIVVLLHTLPAGPRGVRAEEAAYRQYNSCIDFTFQEGLTCGNARKLKRLNAIFERAADRHSGGIREDKLLRLLPSGAAAKYGLDPAAVKRRLQLRREQAAADEAERSKRKKKKRKERKDAGCAREAEVGGVDNINDLRVLSRGTFLAMFANESSTFINIMGQNEKADRERKAMRNSKNGAAGLGISSGSKKKESKHRASSKEGAKCKGLKQPQFGEVGSNHIAPPPAPRALSPHSAPGDVTSSKDRKSRESSSRRKRSSRNSRGGRRSQRRRGRGREEEPKGPSLCGHYDSSLGRSTSRSQSNSGGWNSGQQHRRVASEGQKDGKLSSKKTTGGKHRRHSFDVLPDMKDIMTDACISSDRNSFHASNHKLEMDKDEPSSLSGTSTELDGHSADEAGGRSNIKSDSSKDSQQEMNMIQKKERARDKSEKELSREERKVLRRERRRLKEEARRIEVERELRIVEAKRRILEEEHAKMLQDRECMNTENSEECVFFSSVAKLFKKIVPNMGKNGAVSGVAPAGEVRSGRDTKYLRMDATYGPFNTKVPFDSFSQSAVLQRDHGSLHAGVPLRATRSTSYSSNDSLLGEHMLTGTNTPQLRAIAAKTAAYDNSGAQSSADLMNWVF